MKKLLFFGAILAGSLYAGGDIAPISQPVESSASALNIFGLILAIASTAFIGIKRR